MEDLLKENEGDFCFLQIAQCIFHIRFVFAVRTITPPEIVSRVCCRCILIPTIHLCFGLFSL